MKKLSAFPLKLTAISAMFINHIGHAFEHHFNPDWWAVSYLAIGLLTFPIMAYLLVEGFFYTRNRWKYAGHLLLFAALAYFPFQAVFLVHFNNIMFTLMVGVLMMTACEKVKHPVLQGLILLLAMVVTITSDWMLFGIPLIFAFYKNHGNPRAIPWIIGIACASMIFLQWPALSYPGGWAQVFSNLGILFVIPILRSYNGQRGYCPTWVKWGFYAFYPLHLAILWGVRFLVFGY